jgi:hypothetical protein
VTLLDHIVIAVPDLEAAKERFYSQTGIVPADGGSHTRGGTCNALVAFSDGQYLEFIAPDPLHKRAGSQGERFAALPGPVVLHWAVSSRNLTQLAEAAETNGLTTSGIIPMQRTTPAGLKLEWQLCSVAGHKQGGVMPFFIDWLDSEHPSKTSPMAGRLTNFVVSAPMNTAITRFPRPFPEQTELVQGPLAISFEINSPKGVIQYEQFNPAGFG